MPIFDKYKSRRSFDRAAKLYDHNARLQQQVASTLLNELKKHAPDLNPLSILDLGCGTGQVAEAACNRYGGADVFALDFSERMLTQTEKRLSSNGSNASYICADAEKLPFQVGSFDLIISSLMLQWANNLEETLTQLHATLSENGVLAFSSLSEGTLREIKASWEAVDQAAHSSNFKSLPSFKTTAKAAGFSKVTVISETVIMNYSSVRKMLLEMKGIGASNARSERFKGLTGKQRFEAFEQGYELYRQEDGTYPCTWEVAYVFLC